MDLVDMDAAQRQANNMNNQAIAAHRDLRQAKTSRPSRTHCISCGEPIPKERQEAERGCERCVGCQKVVENLMQWGAW